MMTPRPTKRKIRPLRKPTLARVSELRALTRAGDRARDAFVAKFQISKERTEARLLLHWLLTSNLSTFLNLETDPEISRGEDAPDFVLYGQNEIAVEATTFVTEKKAIYDRAGPLTGLYTSTLRATKADKSFYKEIRRGSLSDNSSIRPRAESINDLDTDFFETIGPVLKKKIREANRYSSLYDLTIILVEDSLSSETDLPRRLPKVENLVDAFQLATNVMALMLLTGRGVQGVAHRL